MVETQSSPFVAACTMNYPSGDNVVDATKTVVVTWGGRSQTVTFNAAGYPLTATNPA